LIQVVEKNEIVVSMTGAKSNKSI